MDRAREQGVDWIVLEEEGEALLRYTREVAEVSGASEQDLRTPMNAIVGYTRILQRRRKGTVEDRQYRNLENINTSADHLLSLMLS